MHNNKNRWAKIKAFTIFVLWFSAFMTVLTSFMHYILDSSFSYLNIVILFISSDYEHRVESLLLIFPKTCQIWTSHKKHAWNSNVFHEIMISISILFPLSFSFLGIFFFFLVKKNSTLRIELIHSLISFIN